ncbi:MAG: N-acetylneuraminate synthase family protein [Vampirovibrionales bacterium]|nr:N-acetylneuraminate synthase family protein [Vampirovibrionales bacterium]
MASTFFKTLKKPFVIAEIGVNHNGDIALAKDLVLKAKATGADVVKFQSFSADTVACRSALSAPHVDKALGFEGTFYELLEKLSLTHKAQRELNTFCKQHQIPFISTPFSFEDVDFLLSLDVPFLKIGSTDTSHLAFLKYAAESGKPLVLSTGMSPMAEVEAAVDVILNTGNENLALLHCVSLYPPEAEELNLKSITALKEKFPHLTVGFSDHTIGTWACTAAVALGAEIIEKHFTLDKKMPGPDHAVSADPEELSKIIEEGALVYRALGSLHKTPSEREAGMEKSFRRSIVTRGALAAGTVIGKEHLDFKRPGTGIHPNRLSQVLGAKTKTAIPADTPIEESMLELPLPMKL